MKSILHPIFLSCRDYTSDVYWKKIFENLAYGEAPKGITLKNHILYSTLKKKEFNYTFEDKEPKEIFEDLYNIFTNTFNMKSHGENVKKQEILNEFLRQNSKRRSEELWNKIKRKSIRDNLIQDYVLSCKYKYNLSEYDVKKLYFYISVGCVFKLFTGNDIYLDKGFINSINGIELDQGTVRILKKFNEPSIKKEVEKTAHLYNLWDNYLKTLV